MRFLSDNLRSSSFFNCAVVICASSASRTGNIKVRRSSKGVRLGWAPKIGFSNREAFIPVGSRCWRTVPMSEKRRKCGHATHNNPAIDL